MFKDIDCKQPGSGVFSWIADRCSEIYFFCIEIEMSFLLMKRGRYWIDFLHLIQAAFCKYKYSSNRKYNFISSINIPVTFLILAFDCSCWSFLWEPAILVFRQWLLFALIRGINATFLTQNSLLLCKTKKVQFFENALFYFYWSMILLFSTTFALLIFWFTSFNGTFQFNCVQRFQWVLKNSTSSCCSTVWWPFLQCNFAIESVVVFLFQIRIWFFVFLICFSWTVFCFENINSKK